MESKQMVWRGLGVASAALLLLFQCSPPLAAQYQGNVAQYQDQYQGQYQDQGDPYAAPLLTPDQLDNLVAPVALYPDRLLSQILVACTYPQEVADAGQWLQQNRGLRGQQLVEAAQQQNWDPSVQALVVFPDVVGRLNSDLQWTTDLGNAFLAQQADLMAAVQRMRARARAAGRLRSNSQEIVTEQYQDGQPYIDIEPANPDVVYVPYYDPAYVWGPPAYGYYPPLVYPTYGFGFYPGIYLTGFFGGWGGWGGWGWYPNWFGGGIFLNAGFFGHFGFHHFDRDDWGRRFDRGFRGGAWTHDPQHRLGVPYSNRTVANRFGGNFSRSGAFNGGRFNGGNNGFANRGNFNNRGNFGSFGNRSGVANQGSRQGFAPNTGTNRSFQGGQFNGGRTNPGFNRPGFNRPGFNQPGMDRQFQQRTPGMNPGTSTGQWYRSNGSNSQPAFRGNTNPGFRGNNNFGNFRNAPSTQPAPAFRGNNNFGGFRGAPASPPAYGNNNGAFHAAPPAQSAPAFRGSSNFGGFRSAPSSPAFRGNSNFGGFRNAPVSNPAPAVRGGNFGGGQPSFHSAPAFRGGGGNGGFSRPAQSFGGGGGGFHGGGGGGGFSRPAQSFGGGGGGGFHPGGGGGGGNHGGGGGHGGRR